MNAREHNQNRTRNSVSREMLKKRNNMAQNAIEKTRSARTTLLQYTKMLDFFYLNKGLAEGKFNVLHGKKKTQKKWAELALELNNIEGPTKTAEQWRVVWRDLKSRTLVKARNLRKAKAMGNNKIIKQSAELSEIELWVIGIVGAEFIEDCAENISKESLQNELIRGNSLILTDTPRVLNACNTLLQQNLQDDPQTSNGDRTNCVRRSAEQLYSSREQFEYITQKQADAMMILAEASKAYAEAATMNSHAMTEVSKAVKKLANNAGCKRCV